MKKLIYAAYEPGFSIDFPTLAIHIKTHDLWDASHQRPNPYRIGSNFMYTMGFSINSSSLMIAGRSLRCSVWKWALYAASSLYLNIDHTSNTRRAQE